MTFKFSEADHVYTLDGNKLPSVTGLLTDQGIIDTKFFTVAGRDRGTAVHKALQFLDEGDLDTSTVDEDLDGYIAAYKRFKKETGFVIDDNGIELSLYHPVHWFAGTLDRKGKLFGRNAIVDLKTTAGKIEDWVGLQLGGYEALVVANYKGWEGDRYALQLKKDGKYKLHPFYEPTDSIVLCNMASIYNWKRNHKLVK